MRELELFEASIRLPKGKFFVTVTEQKHFDKITDPIPNCVKTRLEEFLSGPAMQRGERFITSNRCASKLATSWS